MNFRVTNFKRYSSPDSNTKAFIGLALDVGDDLSTIYLENITIKEITVDGRKKLIVNWPSYKSGETYREIVNIKGPFYWEICNSLLERYMTERDVEE